MYSTILPFFALVAWAPWVHAVVVPSSPMPTTLNTIQATGAKRWNGIKTALNDRTTPDEGPSNFCQQRTPRFLIQGADSQAQQPSGRYQEFIEQSELPISSTAANSYGITVSYPWNGQPGSRNYPTQDEPDTLFFENYYNPKENVIVAVDLWRGKQSPIPDRFSTVTWTMWDQVKQREQDGGTAGDLTALVHYSCVNPDAKRVASWLCTDDDGDDIIDSLTVEPNTDAFNVLLGIPNGAAAFGIVTQHKHALNFKSITSMTVVCDGTPIMGVSYNFG